MDPLHKQRQIEVAVKQMDAQNLGVCRKYSCSAFYGPMVVSFTTSAYQSAKLWIQISSATDRDDEDEQIWYCRRIRNKKVSLAQRYGKVCSLPRRMMLHFQQFLFRDNA